MKTNRTGVDMDFSKMIEDFGKGQIKTAEIMDYPEGYYPSGTYLVRKDEGYEWKIRALTLEEKQAINLTHCKFCNVPYQWGACPSCGKDVT